MFCVCVISPNSRFGQSLIRRLNKRTVKRGIPFSCFTSSSCSFILVFSISPFVCFTEAKVNCFFLILCYWFVIFMLIFRELCMCIWNMRIRIHNKKIIQSYTTWQINSPPVIHLFSKALNSFILLFLLILILIYFS